jgi:hypothetical protein
VKHEKGENNMDIIRTNIADNEWTMDLSYDMFESPDRMRGMDLEGQRVHVDKYCLYVEDDAWGNPIKILTVSTTEGHVFATTSAAFIRTFDRIMELARKCKVTDICIDITAERSKNNRNYITAKYVK